MATVTNKQISDTIAHAVNDAPNRNQPGWMAATDDLITLFVQSGEPFSSGEIASHLRTFAPNLRFSVTSNVGEHLRDRFYADSMPLYFNPADSTHTPVEQVPRTTQGYTRTPVGTQVFVYAPSYTAGSDHDFEVDIPQPGVVTPADPLDVHGLPARPTQAPTPIVPTSHLLTLTPRKSIRDLKVTVRDDGRGYVPRSAFEALLHETKTGLKGGDQVYVNVDDASGTVHINLDRQPGDVAYNVWSTRGCVTFSHPVRPFRAGAAYKLDIDASNRRIVVDISTEI